MKDLRIKTSEQVKSLTARCVTLRIPLETTRKD